MLVNYVKAEIEVATRKFTFRWKYKQITDAQYRTMRLIIQVHYDKMVLIWFLFVLPMVISIRPIQYDVTLKMKRALEPELVSYTQLDGTVNVTFLVLKDRSEVVLRAWRMDFRAVQLFCEGDEIRVLEIQHKKYVDDTVVFRLDQNMTKGQNCRLQVRYVAPMTDQYGVYRSFFPSKFVTDQKTISIATHNEPSLARLWVPCIDSLDSLAAWNLKVFHPGNTRMIGFNTVHSKTENDTKISLLSSSRNIQSARVAFAIFDEKQYKSNFVKAVTNQTLRFWTPRNLTIKVQVKQLLNLSANYFNHLNDIFQLQLDCKTIEIIVVQTKLNTASGCLVFLDHKRNITVHDLRVALAKLWLGSMVMYPDTANAWFPHSLAEYLSAAYENTSVTNLYLLNNTIHNQLILEEPLIPKIPDTWNSLLLYPNKGAMTIAQIAGIMGEAIFREALKGFVARFNSAFVTDNKLFYFLRDYTLRKDRPACYRAFLGTHTDFIGFPVLSVELVNDTTVITQRNFAPESTLDPRYRIWSFVSQWSVPVHLLFNGTDEQMKWLHHDDESLILDKTDENVLVDPNTQGLFLVEYVNQTSLVALFDEYNDCNLFHRYCLDNSINGDFCLNHYANRCKLPEKEIQLLFLGTRHKWDDLN